jgi:esterase/lipase superfamily enzyme
MPNPNRFGVQTHAPPRMSFVGAIGCRFIRASSSIACILLAAFVMTAAGCSGAIDLMPTPNLYADGTIDPFAGMPPEFQNNHVDVLYFTDRQPETKTEAGVVYGYKRSRSVGFGVSEIDIGKNVSWADLSTASRTSNRSVDLELSVAKTTELARFPMTPQSLIYHPPTTAPTPTLTPESGMTFVGDEVSPERLAAEEIVRNEISARMAKTPVKEIYLFVHGFDNDFDDSVETIAQLWHFFGRQGVPIAYTWPAGSKGLLRGYQYDSESSQFTVYHFKQVLRLLASCPDVKRINIIAHSRGTAVAVDGLRELHMEISGHGVSTRKYLKLGTLVLAAPDIDLDVIIQKAITVRLGQVPERFVMYINPNDKALGLSSWLFGNIQRLGDIKADQFSPAELEALRKSMTVQVVQAQISITGSFGHDYFHANPGVSSDLVLVMRFKAPPGAAYGRPLRNNQKGFWIVDDSYPGMEPSTSELKNEESH